MKVALAQRHSVLRVVGLVVLFGAACTTEGVNEFPACPGGSGGRFGACAEAAEDEDLSSDSSADALDADEPLDITPDETEPPADLAAEPDLPEDPVAEPNADLAPDPDLTEPDASDPIDDEPEGPCPPDMALVGTICMDLYEAPNVEGEVPLVMYHYYEAQDWCAARGKRLCFDDEWTLACAGTEGYAYPYGDTRVPGRCNDEETWRAYDQEILNLWPWDISEPDVESLEDLFAAARASSPRLADHMEWLYQGEPGGSNDGCVGEFGVFDLVGNVEEWTTRRDGGSGADFSGNLKGRYWAESRTCQSGVTTHGNAFRFYEIGFRCCLTL